MEPKPEGGNGVPGSKRVAAKAVKASAAKSLFPSMGDDNNPKPPAAQAKQSKLTPRSSTDFDITSSSASETPDVAPVKVAAGKSPCAHTYFSYVRAHNAVSWLIYVYFCAPRSLLYIVKPQKLLPKLNKSN